MSLVSIHLDIDVLAQSSIVHREDYSAVGTDNFALFRREKIITPTGEVMQVPIVSGSSFRGILRRIGESLTAGVLDYEDTALPIPAAHLLTNGGRLAKSARPLTDEEERRLKSSAATDRGVRRRGLWPHHVGAADRRQGAARDRRTRPHPAPATPVHYLAGRARGRRGIV